MEIGLIGGTGDFGEGVTLRAIKNHTVKIGSRDEDRGKKAAEKYSEMTGEEIEGGANEDIADSELVILSVPYRGAVDSIETLPFSDDTIIITPVVNMEQKNGTFLYTPPDQGSVAQELLEHTENPLVGAFHPVAATRLAIPEDEFDIPVFGKGDSKEKVLDFINSMQGLRGIDLGSFEVAPQVESLTPLLINQKEIDEAGIKFV